MKIFSPTIFIMQQNTWKYFLLWKIAFLENILQQPNTALNSMRRVPSGYAEEASLITLICLMGRWVKEMLYFAK